LEEIVGLDTSYHGGAVLGDSDCQPEYITAFNERREKKKRRRSSMSFSSSRSFKAPSVESPMDGTENSEAGAEEHP
jgi:hypothetical protein